MILPTARRLDGFHRVGIPNDICNELGLKEGSALEVSITPNKDILLHKPVLTSFDKHKWARDIIDKYYNTIMAISVVRGGTIVTTNNGETGVARCIPGETFDYNVGVAIGLCRIYNLPIPKGI